MAKIKVLGTEISLIKVRDNDYISLTDMLKAKDGDFFISDWLRNRNTVEFLGVWETVHNPGFNYGEFAIIRSQAGLNNYKMSIKEWTEKTGAIGLRAAAGRYGGTYAHEDIAFEFGMWISAEFKIYLIQEFRRLKEQERGQLGWDIRRNLTKINYRTVQQRGDAQIRDTIKLRETRPFVAKDQGYFVPKKSLFNRIIGDLGFELEFARFLDDCEDVVSFAKNYFAVDFKLDYVNAKGDISNYYPDFLVKLSERLLSNRRNMKPA